MPRLVRRAPLLERIKSSLNPLDFLLWLSEELDSSDWDEFQRSYSIPLGLGLNFVFLIARANASRSRRNGFDDVFGEDSGGSGWLSWFVRDASLLVRFRHATEDGWTDCRVGVS